MNRLIFVWALLTTGQQDVSTPVPQEIVSSLRISGQGGKLPYIYVMPARPVVDVEGQYSLLSKGV